MTTPKLPRNFAVVLFPGFQLLDVCGPLDALNILSNSHPLNLSIIAATLDPVGTQHFVQDQVGSKFNQSIVPTHTFDDAPKDLEVLIIPGGLGNRSDENMKPVVDYLTMLGFSDSKIHEDVVEEDGETVKEHLRGGIKWVLTVCTGSEILARTGVLNGRRATTNKRAFNQVRSSFDHYDYAMKY